jgi:Na+-transporting methylmalonyl-CoA/oxaloacetate decarboxylase gamma subunit
MIDFDPNRAILLTYVGFGAAFVVLGSLIVFTLLLGLLGHLRRRSVANAENAVAATGSIAVEEPASDAAPALDRQLAAAIATAIALAAELERREWTGADQYASEAAAADGEGWKGQGRIVAFDARRLRERDR